MTRHFIPGKDEHYKFIRSEYAQFLGISTNALRMRMRHGKYGTEYVVKDGKYLFKRPRANMVELTTGPRAMAHGSGPKKKYNRGATHRGDAKYGNDSFRRHNEVRALNKIQRNLGDEYTNEINEEVIKIAQERVIRKKDKAINDALAAPMRTRESIPSRVDTTDGKYGTMLNAEGLKSVEDRKHASLARRWLYNSVNDSSAGNSTFFGNFNSNDEKESVEIEDRDIPADDREPRFSSKVEESIWRLKNNK
tara:strand:+ start:53 stop:802 length:750 start_codon:yes stop_codon:yes gene_type:complete